MPDHADPKELTLKTLKELAKKHVGTGHTKLKTKAELLKALKKIPKALASVLKGPAKSKAKGAQVKTDVAPAKSKAAPRSPSAKSPARRVSAAGPKSEGRTPSSKKKVVRPAKPPVKKSAARPEAQEATEETPTVGGRRRAVKTVGKGATKPVLTSPRSKGAAKADHTPVEAIPPRTRLRAVPGAEVGEGEKAVAPRRGPAQVVRFERPARRLEPSYRRTAEPLVEGFFVARIAGAQEVQSHPLGEASHPPAPPQPSRRDREDPEGLGELAWGYGSDQEIAAARDPRTLFYFWDFSGDTLRAAAQGLQGPRAVLVLFHQGGVAREVDFALESRSYYLHDLSPGETYRIEAYFVGADGHRRRMGRGSNSVTLPPDRPSSDTTVRFMRVPWGQPLGRRGEAPAAAVERRYLTWHRVQLPHSAGVVDRLHEWTERDESVGGGELERSYLGSSFNFLGGSSEWMGLYLGASEQLGSRPAPDRGGRA